MLLKTLVALAFVLLSLRGPAAAAPPLLPKGAEFRVNTNTRGTQLKPSIAAFPEGGFVVVWRSSTVALARFLDPEGRPAGGQIRLRGVGGNVDHVVADRDGSFLVVWTGYAPVTSGSAIFVRRFHRDGTPQGPRIRVSVPGPNFRYDAVAAIGPDGRFAVAWKEDVPVPRFAGVSYINTMGRIFTAQGTPLTPEILLRAGEEPTPAGDDAIHSLPSSLVLKPDGTLAAMVHDVFECLQSFLVQVSPGGERSTQSLGPVHCNDPMSGFLTGSLAMGRDGSLVATWSISDVIAQRFAPNGTPRGSWFGLSAQEVSDQYEPVAALQAGGSFVVAWSEEDRDGEGLGIFGRAFAADGTPRTQDFRINTTTAGDQYEPAIAAARQGPAVVVWVQKLFPGGRADIFARVLSPDR